MVLRESVLPREIRAGPPVALFGAHERSIEQLAAFD